MLTRLIPEQVSRFWDIIKYGIEQSLPPIVGESPNKMNNILTSLLTEKTQCWVSYNREKEKKVFEGIVLTRVIYDDASQTKNLLIYCLYGYEDVNSHSWQEGLTSLVKYAKSIGCNQIVAYSNIDYIINIAKQLDAGTVYQFITFNVNEIIKKFN